jgi:threonine/homoserine/homoserine lactone efflux protein
VCGVAALYDPCVPDWSTLAAFCAATVALLLIPGPAMLYVINRSVADGREVGLAAVAGLEVGDAIQAAAAALGLSAVLATSATAFGVIKWAGAIYLVVTGIRTLVVAPAPIDPDQPGVSVRRAFRQGIIVNALNPKTALFFLSIFPQFVNVDDPHAGTQSLVLGGVFVVLATLFNGSYSLMASALRHLLLRGRALPFVRRYVSGTLFVGLGVLAATAGHASASSR